MGQALSGESVCDVVRMVGKALGLIVRYWKVRQSHVLESIFRVSGISQQISITSDQK